MRHLTVIICNLPSRRGSHLTPIEWVFTITSVGLGTYLVEVLKELGKRSTQEVLDWLAAAKKRRTGPDVRAVALMDFKADSITVNVDAATRLQSAGKDVNRVVIVLLVNEVFPACQTVDDQKVLSVALSSSFSAAKTVLVELGLPDDDADELAAAIVLEVSRAIEQYLEARGRGDHNDPAIDHR